MKLSAGVVCYRFRSGGEFEVLLVHPGGPFWKNKDEGAWSIPKGEYTDGKDALVAARREFEEETGNVLPEGEFMALTPVKNKGGKLITAFAIETDFAECFIKSNYFEMEWPPRSGRKQSFPEVDSAEWFVLKEARVKINASQIAIIEELAKRLSGDDYRS